MTGTPAASLPGRERSRRRTLILAGCAGSVVLCVFGSHAWCLTYAGPTGLTDALFAVLTAPALILAVFGIPMQNVLIPLLSGSRTDRAEPVLLRHVLTIAILVGCGLALAAPWWAAGLFPILAGEQPHLLVTLARIVAIHTTLSLVGNALVAVHHSHQRFEWVASVQALAAVASFVAVATVFTATAAGITAALWAMALRPGLEVLLLVRRSSICAPAGPDLRRQFWQRLRPLMLGNSYYKSDILLDRYLTGMAAAGSLSLYTFALNLHGAVSQILVRSVAAPTLPALSRAHADNDVGAFSRILARTTRALSIVSILLVVLMLGGFPLVSGFLPEGTWSTEQRMDLWLVLGLSSGVMVGGVIGYVLASAFYARGDNTALTRLGCWSFTIAIPVKIGGFLIGGLPGLALAASLYYLWSAAAEWIILRRRGNPASANADAPKDARSA